MKEVSMEIVERETDLKEDNPHERGIKARLLAFITRWVQITLLDFFC